MFGDTQSDEGLTVRTRRNWSAAVRHLTEAECASVPEAFEKAGAAGISGTASYSTAITALHASHPGSVRTMIAELAVRSLTRRPTSESLPDGLLTGRA